MNIEIKNIKIEGLFGFRNIDWKLDKTNILVGKNGAGKSTILLLIYHTLLARNIESNNSELFLRVAITLSDNEVVYSLPNYFGINGDLPNGFEDIIQSDLSKPIDTSSEANNDATGAFLIGSLLGTIIGKSTGFGLASGIGALLLAQSMAQNNIGSTEKAISIEPPKFSLEFISTANMNANSIHEITTSDGNTANILDYEIEAQLKRLLKLNNHVLVDKLQKALNSIFIENNKVIILNQNNEFKIRYKGINIPFSGLSSGEKQIIYIFIKVIIASHTGAIVLMDEPEISLHLSWQEKLLTEIRKVNSVSQVIIVTHSPALVMNGWFDCLTEINDIYVDELSFKEVK